MFPNTNSKTKTDEDDCLIKVSSENENETYDDASESLLDHQVVEPSSDPTFCRNINARHSLAMWVFVGFICLYASRVNLSVAIVGMVAPQSALNQSKQACPTYNKNSSKPEPHYEFHWSPKTQGLVLGAFFYGYIVIQIVGGNLAEKYGAKWILGGAVLATGLLTLLTPVAARTHVAFLFTIRFLIGFASGPMFPAAGALWGKWVPPLERSTIPPAAQTGTNFGIIITTPLVSLLSSSKFLGGWPSVFYVFGILSCLWFIGWSYFAYNSPSVHPRISAKEKMYLLKYTASSSKKIVTPWKKILTCVPLYGISIMHVCQNFVYYTLFTSLPTYFSTILNFNLEQNGVLFAIPYFGLFLVTIISGQIVRRIKAKNILTITNIRRLQTIFGAVGSSIFLVSIGFCGCNHISAVICSVFAVAFLGFHNSGCLISHLDVASNYAGTLVGITNSLATIPGFVGPAVVGAITNHNQTIHAWKIIFILSASIHLFGCIIYCILFKGEEQEWNRQSEYETEQEIIQ